MNERDRFARGAAGEKRVADILEELRTSLGFAYVHDVLLCFNGKTTQIDHVLIDRYGVLVIETKTYGALLKGTSDDRFWTACYRSGQSRQMLNPLFQNDGHRKWLHKLLLQQGRTLPENYVQSLVVFVKSEIGELGLSDADRLRVISTPDLGPFVRARYDFCPNEGQLGYEAQLDLYEFILSANQSGDPEAVARHVASVKKAKAKKSSRPARVFPLHPRFTTHTPRRGRYAGSKKQATAGTGLVKFLLGVLLLLVVVSCGRCGVVPPAPSTVYGQPGAASRSAVQVIP